MIKENIEGIRGKIRDVCIKKGRDYNKILILAVTKGREPDKINEVLSLGIRDIGENKVQEAKLKKGLTNPVKWHMIGHLQTNKVKDAVQIFDLIHSVDSIKLAREINKEAERINKIQDILIEVKTSKEETKQGISPEEVEGFVEEIRSLKNLNLKGLMTIAPQGDKEEARRCFRSLRELRDKIDRNMILSMGMSDDFEIAVEEGADILRIGRAIFD